MRANTGRMEKKNISQKNNNKKKKSSNELEEAERKQEGWIFSAPLRHEETLGSFFKKIIFLSKRNRTNYIFLYFLSPPPLNYR